MECQAAIQKGAIIFHLLYTVFYRKRRWAIQSVNKDVHQVRSVMLQEVQISKTF